LSALLAHDAVFGPGGKGVVEPFIGGAGGLLCRIRLAGRVEVAQISHPVICGAGHYPGIASAAQSVREAALVLEKKQRLGRQCSIYGIPVNTVSKVNVEVGHDRTATHLHVGGRGEISLLNVLQVFDQRLLCAATGAGVRAYGTLVHHDGKGETGVSFRLVHYELRGGI
jgi:hypothetical protein